MDVTSKYFDLNRFETYLRSNLQGCNLSVRQIKRNQEQLTLDRPQSSSFQISEIDTLGNVSFTSGSYINRKTGERGNWEEFRLRVKSTKHFVGVSPLESGKYRIRVQDEEGWEKPVVETFVRGFGSWKKKSLPSPIPLVEILKRGLSNYRINP